MIHFIEKKQGTKIPKHDYLLEKEDALEKLVDVLTPKFEGTWSIGLFDPPIKFVNNLVDSNWECSYVDLYLYLSSNQLDSILLKHPKLVPKKQSAKEAFMTVVAELKSNLAHDASKYLYKAFEGKVEEMAETLKQLDESCTTGLITLDDVKSVCSVIKRPLYASEVYRAFMCKSRDRWRLLSTLVHELGESYAYYALRKQSLSWLRDKADYLQNEDTKNRNINDVDASYISYAYVCFINSNSPSDLYCVMYDIDNRNVSVLERRLVVNLQ